MKFDLLASRGEQLQLSLTEGYDVRPAQGMILIADPAYNEPNVEQMRATAEGEARSRLYNAEVLDPLPCILLLRMATSHKDKHTRSECILVLRMATSHKDKHT